MVNKLSYNKKIINKHMKKLMKKEKYVITSKQNKFLKQKISPMIKNIEKKVPSSVKHTFYIAFEKGFKYVFEKGTVIIEKTYSLKKLNDKFDINKYILDKNFNSKNIKKFDIQVSKGIFANKIITTAEGAIMGFLGIGIPDIPIFIAVILKTIYEICVNYGFEYDSDEEKMFILNIICMSASKGEEKEKYSDYIDKIGYDIDNGNSIEIDIKHLISITSEKMSLSMITSKFLQGIMLIGVIGSISNYKIIKDIGKISNIKYKKRFLNKLSIS